MFLPSLPSCHLNPFILFPVSQSCPLEAPYCGLADQFIYRKLLFPLDTFFMKSEEKEQGENNRTQAVSFGCFAFLSTKTTWLPFRTWPLLCAAWFLITWKAHMLFCLALLGPEIVHHLWGQLQNLAEDTALKYQNRSGLGVHLYSVQR